MSTIFKYHLDIRDEQILYLPAGHKILSVHEQAGSLMLWAIVDPSIEETVPRVIHIRGTGHPMPKGEDVRFINTVLLLEGSLVFHVFWSRCNVKRV